MLAIIDRYASTDPDLGYRDECKMDDESESQVHPRFYTRCQPPSVEGM